MEKNEVWENIKKYAKVFFQGIGLFFAYVFHYIGVFLKFVYKHLKKLFKKLYRIIRRHIRRVKKHMKAGDYLVKNQQTAIFFCQGSDVFEIILCRQDRPGIAHKGLHDDGGNFVALFLQ